MTDNDELHDLREQVSEQQQTIQKLTSALGDVVENQRKMMPNRRQVLKAGGAAALFGAGAVGGASAAPGDDGDTVWGSDANRDDYYAGEIDAISVSTGVLNSINYFPAERVESLELNTSSPATSFTDVTLSSLPSDASIAIIRASLTGDGTADRALLKVREKGSGRVGLEAATWAGHGARTGVSVGTVPVDSNNVVEYDTFNASNAQIYVEGYY